jgi:hypothetical protein
MNMHARIDALHDTRPLIARVPFRFDVGGEYGALYYGLLLRRSSSPARAGVIG